MSCENNHELLITEELECEVTQKEALEVFKLLTYTYHRYHDSKSREAVENIIKQLSVLSLETTEQMARWTRLETARICEQRYDTGYMDVLELIRCEVSLLPRLASWYSAGHVLSSLRR